MVLATRLFQVSRIPAELQIPSLAPNLAPSGLHFLGRSRQGCQLMGAGSEHFSQGLSDLLQHKGGKATMDERCTEPVCLNP